MILKCIGGPLDGTDHKVHQQLRRGDTIRLIKLMSFKDLDLNMPDITKPLITNNVYTYRYEIMSFMDQHGQTNIGFLCLSGMTSADAMKLLINNYKGHPNEYD